MKYLGLLGWLALCLATELFAGQFRPGEWYAALEKPGWTPPDWVFPVVWTTLYLLMGVAAWQVWWRSGWRVARATLTLFLTQLVLNGLWSWLFFGLHRPGWALLDLALLWLVLLATTVAFWRQSRLAGALLIPYLLWVSYAATLNVGVWLMN